MLNANCCQNSSKGIVQTTAVATAGRNMDNTSASLMTGSGFSSKNKVKTVVVAAAPPSTAAAHKVDISMMINDRNDDDLVFKNGAA